MDSLENKVEVELTATEKLAQFEKEKLSRRQALARIGFQAGAAAIAALTADELLRKVGKEMQRRAGDNKVVEQVAKEFEEAGVASALPPEPSVSQCHKDCTNVRANSILTICAPQSGNAYIECCKEAYINWCKCLKSNNCPEASYLPAQCSDSCYCGGC